MSDMFKALGTRIERDEARADGLITKIILILAPLITYQVINFAVLYIVVFLTKVIADESALAAGFMADYSKVISIVTTIISMLITVAVHIGTIRYDRPVICRRDEPVRWISLVILLGASAALFFNVLFSITGFTSVSKTAIEVSESQFSLPLAVGVIYYGLLTPLFEEILFRLLIYNRIRREFGLYAGLILCPVLFGLYHGNIVQGVYGFIMGLIICWVYERYGSFIYPYILHSAANTFIYIFVSVNVLKQIVSGKAGLFVTGVIMVVAICCIIGSSEKDLIDKKEKKR